MANMNRVISQAQMLEDQEKYEEALSVMEQSYNEFKNDPEFVEKIALLAKTLNKTEDETKYWEELVVIQPDNLMAYQELLGKYFETDKYSYYLTRAKYKILNGKLIQALDDYKKAYDSTTEAKKIGEARFLRAKLLEELGKTQGAIDEYYRIIELEPLKEAYLKLGDLYASNDRLSAINVLKQGMEHFPDDEMMREFLANLYLKEGQYDDALSATKDTMLSIKAYLMKGDNDKAFELLNSAEDKNSAKYHSLMAEYFFNIKDFDKCKDEIKQFRELEPQNPLGFQMLAMICDAKDDLYGYHYNMGRCYSLKQDYDLALNEYFNAHKADAKGTEAIKEIIKINENANNPSLLMEFYEKLLKSEPDNTDALKGLAKFYSDMYEFRQALEYLGKWKELRPNDAQAYYQLGVCYEKLKNMKLAKENYNIYLSKAPLSPDTENLRERVEKMSDEGSSPAEEDEGLLDKIMKIFGK